MKKVAYSVVAIAGIIALLWSVPITVVMVIERTRVISILLSENGEIDDIY